MNNHYNGPPSQLMDELVEALNQRTEPEMRDVVFEVYLARACKTLENLGWERFIPPQTSTIVCPGCGWIGEVSKLDPEGNCPVCEYSDGDHRLPTLEEVLTNSDNNWNDVAIGPFALAVCRTLHINRMLNFIRKTAQEIAPNCTSLEAKQIIDKIENQGG